MDPARPGNDITVTVAGNTAQLQAELVSPNPMIPAITTDFQGEQPGPVSSLCLAVNFTNQSQAVRVIVDFSSQYSLGVQNVSFTLFDVDFDNVAGRSTYQDQLRNITATAVDASQVAATITTSSDNSLSGSGLTQVVDGTVSTVDTGAGSANGNVTITFGANGIKPFTFIYGSGSGTAADPTYQHVGIYDVSFTPVPEINPAWSAVGSCLIAAALIFRHSARFRK